MFQISGFTYGEDCRLPPLVHIFIQRRVLFKKDYPNRPSGKPSWRAVCCSGDRSCALRLAQPHSGRVKHCQSPSLYRTQFDTRIFSMPLVPTSHPVFSKTLTLHKPRGRLQLSSRSRATTIYQIRWRYTCGYSKRHIAHRSDMYNSVRRKNILEILVCRHDQKKRGKAELPNLVERRFRHFSGSRCYKFEGRADVIVPASRWKLPRASHRTLLADCPRHLALAWTNA
jgi:hypothetical protein